MAARASELATPSATSEVLALFGLAPKKGFGQNFLVNDDVVRRILRLADVRADDDILEVGPGIGTLSCALADAARSVVAIERDADLTEVLAHTMGRRPGFQLVMRDAVDAGAADIEAAQEALRQRGVPCAFPRKLVANLPYAVAATVVLGFFQRFEGLASATVMVQREVAERMQAQPGTKAYGAYTVKLALFARPRGSFRVAAGNFLPAPHVESAVIRLDRVRACGGDGAPCTPAEVRAACTMADAAFAARRKTIANSCRMHLASMGSPLAARVPDMLQQAGIDASLRGEALAPADYLKLGRALLAAEGAPADIV